MMLLPTAQVTERPLGCQRHFLHICIISILHKKAVNTKIFSQ